MVTVEEPKMKLSGEISLPTIFMGHLEGYYNSQLIQVQAHFAIGFSLFHHSFLFVYLFISAL